MTDFLDPAQWAGLLQGTAAEMVRPGYWVAVLQIIWVNILLSGDNALVIALACRGLQPRQRLGGMIFGAGAAVLLRIVFTGIVATLMTLPFLKLVGGVALIFIAAKMLVPDNRNEDAIEAVEHLWRAVWTIAVADVIMSLDNVIAIAAAANGRLSLLVIGLAFSIPLIVAGAAMIMALLDRVPILVWAGAGLLGWIAGEVIATDPVVVGWLTPRLGAAALDRVEIGVALTGVVLVLLLGWRWRRSKAARFKATR